jgi:hypothetical protein
VAVAVEAVAVEAVEAVEGEIAARVQRHGPRQGMGTCSMHQFMPPHDYTDVIKIFNDQQREHEVKAEIAGFNTLADYVRKQNPHASREITC